MTENNKNIEENIETKPTRRYDIDALRVFATMMLIYVHTANLFALYLGYFIQNEELNLETYLFLVFVVELWHMPLFFFLAGMGTFYSLNFRTGIQYRKERVKRLLIPFLLGILIVIPPIVYFERLAWWSDTRYTSINYNGTFFEFYPQYFEIGTIAWYHLWFILYLFVFSLVALPLFLKLKKDKGKQQISSIANYFGKGKKIFLFALPIIIINVCLRWIFPGAPGTIYDWANVLDYLTFFIFGFLIIGDNRFENSFDRNKRLALVLAVILSFFVLLFAIPVSSSNNVNPIDYFIGYTIFWALFSFCSWCWLITIFGYGRKYLTKQNSLIRYLSEISLPFYIIHLTIIIMIGFYVLQWETHWGVKFLVISTSSLFITILLCQLVKTNNITRFIFGMRTKVKKKEVK